MRKLEAMVFSRKTLKLLIFQLFSIAGISLKLGVELLVIQESHQFSFLKISNAGDAAFYQCESLEEIRFADDSQLETTGIQFFSGNFYN